MMMMMRSRKCVRGEKDNLRGVKVPRTFFKFAPCINDN